MRDSKKESTLLVEAQEGRTIGVAIVLQMREGQKEST